jgi:glycosyltransferase involved in cell wall biosynthesis
MRCEKSCKALSAPPAGGYSEDEQMRICIVAEHASYRFGGEAILPIHYFARLRARGEEAWLVVHARTRDELEAAFPSDRSRLRFVEDAWFHRLLSRMSVALPRRIAGSTVSLLSMLITQFLARRIVLALRDSEGLDVVHQPIPVSPRFPSLMYGLNLPVIIGPMNGGMDYPPAFRHSESILSRVGVSFGRYFSNLVNSVLPGKKLASVLLVANRRTRHALPRGFKGEVVELPENGVDLSIWSAPERKRGDAPPAQKPAHFIFVGRLIDWKCLDVILEALSQVRDAQLEVIGDGSMRKEWEHLAEKLGVTSRVTFSGWLTQTECALHMESAMALLLPSVYECGGAVVLEAMAAGVAVIATKWGGPVDYVDSATGILIEPKSRCVLVEGFAAAMNHLVAEPESARTMGLSGREKVEQYFDWERKVNSIMRIYEEAIAGFKWKQ